MLSVKTINNQNAIINAVLGLDGNSNTIINGNLTLQDTSGSFVITPSGTISATNTTLNNLLVNGTSNFNSGVGFNAGCQIRDLVNNTFSQLFHSFNTLQIQTWTANGRIKLNTTGATVGVTNQNLLVENGNHAQQVVSIV